MPTPAGMTMERLARNLIAIADGKPEQFDLIPWSASVSTADRLRYIAKELRADELTRRAPPPASGAMWTVTDEMVVKALHAYWDCPEPKQSVPWDADDTKSMRAALSAALQSTPASGAMRNGALEEAAKRLDAMAEVCGRVGSFDGQNYYSQSASEVRALKATPAPLDIPVVEGA